MRIAIASIGGREELLKQSIDSLYDQAEHIYVCLNNYDSIPDFLTDDKISFIERKNKYGDAYKFYWVDKYKGVIGTCDDDIIYPSNYCAFLERGLRKYGGVVTVQGRVFDKYPIHSYYHRATERVFCQYVQMNDTKVHFGGTGVMCFDTREVSPPLKYFKKKNMADIWMGLYCMENGIEITAIAHPEDFVEPIECRGIWHDTHNKDWEQVKIINEFIEAL